MGTGAGVRGAVRGSHSRLAQVPHSHGRNLAVTGKMSVSLLGRFWKGGDTHTDWMLVVAVPTTVTRGSHPTCLLQLRGRILRGLALPSVPQDKVPPHSILCINPANITAASTLVKRPEQASVQRRKEPQRKRQKQPRTRSGVGKHRAEDISPALGPAGRVSPPLSVWQVVEAAEALSPRQRVVTVAL